MLRTVVDDVREMTDGPKKLERELESKCTIADGCSALGTDTLREMCAGSVVEVLVGACLKLVEWTLLR